MGWSRWVRAIATALVYISTSAIVRFMLLKRITHRGFSFYVDGKDVSSKQVLEGLVSNHLVRMGGASGLNNDPRVVIPVG